MVWGDSSVGQSVELIIPWSWVQVPLVSLISINVAENTTGIIGSKQQT